MFWNLLIVSRHAVKVILTSFWSRPRQLVTRTDQSGSALKIAQLWTEVKNRFKKITLEETQVWGMLLLDYPLLVDSILNVNGAYIYTIAHCRAISFSGHTRNLYLWHLIVLTDSHLWFLPGVTNKVHLDKETLTKPGLCDNPNKTQILCITFWTSFLVFLYDGMQVKDFALVLVIPAVGAKNVTTRACTETFSLRGGNSSRKYVCARRLWNLM